MWYYVVFTLLFLVACGTGPGHEDSCDLVLCNTFGRGYYFKNNTKTLEVLEYDDS